MKRLATTAAIAAMATNILLATITVPQFITDNMVVQQLSTLTIPGHATPGSKIVATADWGNGVEVTTTTSANGTFSVALPTPEAGGPFTIMLTEDDGEPKVLSNILSGEVWLCSGQSNMEFPVKGWTEVYGGDEVVATANQPAIRLLLVRDGMAFKPQEDTPVEMGGWIVAAPNTMNFSAIAYLFALRMQKELGVPIGVIDSSWGGTPAEAWTALGAIDGIPELQYAADALKADNGDGKAVKEVFDNGMQAWLKEVTGTDITFDKAKMQCGPEWKQAPVPSYWDDSYLPGFDGSVWFQRSLTLPASAAGKPLQLNIGQVDNMDETYFNGIRLGGIDNFQLPRSYEVPGELVKEGENVISVRVIDFNGGGGIVGHPDNICAVVDGQTYPLAGTWNYRVVGPIQAMPQKPADPFTTQYPTVLFNAMINPLRVMPVKGVLWYQGCGNVGSKVPYARLFKSLIQDWRRLYNNPEMPFYFVQLAGWLGPQNVQPDSNWAELRLDQARALELPHTGMATAIDLGNPADIHPTNKQEVARRLALLALNHTYGHTDVVSEAPVCIKSTPSGSKLELTFSDPVHAPAKAITGFIVGDSNGNFAYAKAEQTAPDVVVLSSPLIKNPTIARYAWADYPQASLTGSTGLPVTPFATDK